MKQALLGLLALAAAVPASLAMAQTAQEVRGPAAVVPLASQPPAKLVVDPPLPGPLAFGRVVIQYRTENLRILPVFGPKAAGILPRIGHLHVSVDELPWHWADASDQPLIFNGFPAGPHKVRIDLEDPNHQPLDHAVVDFVVPARNTNGH